MSKYLLNASRCAIFRIFAVASRLAFNGYSPLNCNHVNKAYEEWMEAYTEDCAAFNNKPEDELIETIKASITLLCSNFKE